LGPTTVGEPAYACTFPVLGASKNLKLVCPSHNDVLTWTFMSLEVFFEFSNGCLDGLRFEVNLDAEFLLDAFPVSHATILLTISHLSENIVI